MKNGFFAYSSDPAYCGECINEAIIKINKGGLCNLNSWETLIISGKFIISRILNEIDKSDFFCADITGLNYNVLFELGYAIAKNKPIWLLLDDSNENSMRRYREINFLTTVGYSNYNNTQNIIDSFYKDKPYEYTEGLYYKMLFPYISQKDLKPILYLKGQIETNFSQEIINQIDYFKLPAIIDDAQENKIEPINWYFENLFKVTALIAEFSPTTRVGHDLQNLKCSFISGIALGLGLRLLMLAERPFKTPMDYRDLLTKYTTRRECIDALRPFLEKLRYEIAGLMSKKTEAISHKRKRSVLQQINFGEYIAEHESNILYEYYIETTHFQSLLKNEYNIVIGRKGTGKTAALYYIDQYCQRDKRYHVCLIKPINFEIDGLVIFIDNLNDEFEKGFLIEVIWKFLIYTEIAKTLYISIKSKPEYAKLEQENDFIKFIEDNKDIFLTDFSTRLEVQIEKLKEGYDAEKYNNKHNEYRIKVSEILHSSLFPTLRDFFCEILTPKEKIVVLIDNLDKSWRKESRLNIISKCLLGLLGVTGRIAKDLANIKKQSKQLEFHLTIFLRSDIFKYVLSFAREPDKIEHFHLRYSDTEIFFRIIEERFAQLNETEIINTNELWTKYIVNKVDSKPVKEFIKEKILPRPRDIIYFFKIAKDVAISRGHIRIEEEDIIKGYHEYSNWLFTSVLVENGITIEQMNDFMYKLMGSNSVLSKSEIITYARAVGIKIIEEEFIDHLVALSIFGREVKKNIFYFDYEFDSSEKNKALASKYNSDRFKIHDAFVPYLECRIEELK